MLSLEELRKADPKLANVPDKELEKIRGLLYGSAELALESYFDSKKKKDR
jgi:hypothetical protein